MIISEDHNRAADTAIPSFSVILETENLATTATDDLLLALDSLSRQDLPVTEATDVFVLNSGDASADVLTTIANRFPWVRIVRIDDGQGYYGAKIKGASSTDADIVIFADSDCVYTSTWLRSMVEPFCSDEIHIMAGESMITGGGPYGLANHFTFFFDGFSGARSLYRTRTYFANNFACRRSLLERYPIPDNVPLYGITIWGQPNARAQSLILAGYWVTKTQAGLLIGLHESLEQKAGEI